MIDPKELEFFKKEYPEFDEEEIIEILESLGEVVGEDPDNFGAFMNKDKVKSTGIIKSLKKILDIDD